MIFLIIMIVGCILLASFLKNINIEELIPTVFLSIPVFIFPFYCVDRLIIGKYIIYAFLTVLFVVSFVLYFKNNKGLLIKELLKPSIIIFILTCIIVIVMTSNNYVALWDESRLWGAYPKILWYYGKRQLGPDVLLYPRTQSYPPGMPLLVYFVQSLDPSFRESMIFGTYGIFVASLLLPSLIELKWNRKKLIFPIAIFIVLLPCIITSHGGDYAYFYQSLFIDPVLGAVTGYALYISSKNKMRDVWSVFNVCVASCTLVLFKDSGILFAAAICMNSLLQSVFKLRKFKIYMVFPFVLSIVYYFVWQSTIKVFAVKNTVGLKEQLSVKSLRKMAGHLLRDTLIKYNIKYPSLSMELSFFWVIIICIIAVIIMTYYCKDFSVSETIIASSVLAFTSIVFIIGYSLTYGTELPSFQRYMGTVTGAVLYYVVFRFLAIITGMDQISVPVNYNKKIRLLIILFAVLGCVTILFYDSKTRFNECPKEEADDNSERIKSIIAKNEKNELGTEKNAENKMFTDVFLFFPGDASSHTLLHHRIYLNLIGTDIRIRNYCWDMQLYDSESKKLSLEESNNLFEKWEEDLFKNYDYLYVLGIDYYNTLFLQKITGDQIKKYDMYIVDKDNRTLHKIE